MKRFRFNIASLLIVVLFIAVGFAALCESNDLWDRGLFTLTLGLLLVSILLAIHRAESRRAFWIGFALFGAAYLGLSLVPSIESRLMTTRALMYLDSMVPGRPPASNLYSAIDSWVRRNQFQAAAFSPDGRLLASASQGQARVWDMTTGKLVGAWRVTTENFVRIGHSLVVLLAGWFGGLLSRRLYRASSATDASAPINDEGTNP
jgi:hypothetical protein